MDGWLVDNSTLHDVREYKRDLDDMARYYRRYSFALFGLVIPITALVGLAGGFLTWLVYHHPKLKGFSGVIMQMIALADVVSMASIFAMYFPPMWLHHRFHDLLSTEFLNEVNSIQQRYVFLYPLAGLSHSMIAWYTVVYIGEYYFSVTSPRYLLEFSKRGNVAKVLMTVFNLTVIVHLMCYFCLTTHEMYYEALIAKRICLSDAFGRHSVQNYDKYLYVFVSFVFPWLIALGCLSLIYYKVKHRAEPANVLDQTEANLSPADVAVVLNGGRSRGLLITMGTMFVVLEGVSILVYLVIVETIDFAENPKACRVLPQDRRFMHVDPVFELAYICCCMVQSVLRFPMCICSSKAFRESLVSILSRTSAASHRVCRTIHTFGKSCTNSTKIQTVDEKPHDSQCNITVVSTLPPRDMSNRHRVPAETLPDDQSASVIVHPVIVRPAVITPPKQTNSFYNSAINLEDEPGIEI